MLMVNCVRNSMIHRKETLVITAIEIIHEKGFQGLSTREVAKREGISEAAIFKHFKTKNDLVLAVLDLYSQYDEALVESAVSKGLTPREMLFHIYEGFLNYYENYPEITAVNLAYGCIVYEKDLKEKINKIGVERAKIIRSIIQKAIEAGELASSTDSEILTDQIMGTAERIILKWRYHNFSFSLREYTLSALNCIFDANAPSIE